MGRMTVDIVSDVMCPWCYIGKKRFEKAVSGLRDTLEVDVRWRPFQLDPTLPKEGRDRKEYLQAKFGGSGRARQAYDAIREAGAEEGIRFDFEAIAVSPNTLDAHRVIRWASSAGGGVQERVVDVLFRMYFTEGRNIGDPIVLLEAAAEAGMDASVVEALLRSDADRPEVTEEIATARRMGVTGVPCFILDGRYAVIGAQPADDLASALAGISAESEKRATPT